MTNAACAPTGATANNQVHDDTLRLIAVLLILLIRSRNMMQEPVYLAASSPGLSIQYTHARRRVMTANAVPECRQLHRQQCCGTVLVHGVSSSVLPWTTDNIRSFPASPKKPTFSKKENTLVHVQQQLRQKKRPAAFSKGGLNIRRETEIVQSLTMPLLPLAVQHRYNHTDPAVYECALIPKGLHKNSNCILRYLYDTIITIISIILYFVALLRIQVRHDNLCIP